MNENHNSNKPNIQYKKINSVQETELGLVKELKWSGTDYWTINKTTRKVVTLSTRYKKISLEPCG